MRGPLRLLSPLFTSEAQPTLTPSLLRLYLVYSSFCKCLFRSETLLGRICLRRRTAGLGFCRDSLSAPPHSPSRPTLRLLAFLASPRVLFFSITLWFPSLVDCVKLQKGRALPVWWPWMSYLGSLSVFPSGKWG